MKKYTTAVICFFITMTIITILSGCSIINSKTTINNSKNKKNQLTWVVYPTNDEKPNGKYVFRTEVAGKYSGILASNEVCFFDIFYNEEGWFTIFTHPTAKTIKDSTLQFQPNLWKVTFDFKEKKYEYYTSQLTNKKEGIGFFKEYGQAKEVDDIVKNFLLYDSCKISIVCVQDEQYEYTTNKIDLIDFKGLYEAKPE